MHYSKTAPVVIALDDVAALKPTMPMDMAMNRSYDTVLIRAIRSARGSVTGTKRVTLVTSHGSCLRRILEIENVDNMQFVELAPQERLQHALRLAALLNQDQEFLFYVMADCVTSVFRCLYADEFVAKCTTHLKHCSSESLYLTKSGVWDRVASHTGNASLPLSVMRGYLKLRVCTALGANNWFSLQDMFNTLKTADVQCTDADLQFSFAQHQSYCAYLDHYISSLT